jgi:hypothetical protein
MQRIMTSRIAILLCALMACADSGRTASLDGLAVRVTNKSEPVLCAEKDNVSIAMAADDVRSFRIEAAHPVYIGMVRRDNWEADWTACDVSGDPVHPAKPRKVTFYEDTDLWIVGYTFESFWRPNTIPVRVGDRVQQGLHMLQVWMLRPTGAEEVLVLYPPDGYWRARPFTPEGLKVTAYGSSFLVGPIEEAGGRPVVNFKEIVFDPESRTFTLQFSQEGSAAMRIASADTQKLALDVSFDRPIAGRPFAMLRSMYVTEFNNDVARIAVREKDAAGWREDNIMKFGRAMATDIWTGRLLPSQHNTSSPDMVFNSFSDGPTPKRPRSEPPPPLSPAQKL